MCGLAGMYIPKRATIPSPDLTMMATVIKHRGPDSETNYCSENRRFQCVFNRLAIIDLETGNQPILAEDNSIILLGNGEIYNFLEIRNEQLKKGYRFRSNGDMEVILPLFAEKAQGFVHDLNGMFSLAIYDKNLDKLLLVRDRLGIKPLYWAKLPGGGVLFASEIKSIFASGLILPTPNENLIGSYLSHGYIPGPDTLYKGVFKLKPGHILTCDNKGSIESVCYWRPKPLDNKYSSIEEASEDLTQLLTESIKMQLNSDVPIGALLSGGLDSGLMVGIAAEQHDRPLNTFTACFEGTENKEAPLAKIVSKQYGTIHEELMVRVGDISKLLPRLAWHCEEPLFDSSLLPNFLIEESLSKRVKVALNGTGGDELFAGYGRYFLKDFELFYRKIPLSLRANFEKFLNQLGAANTAWKLRRVEKFKADLGGYLNDQISQFPEPLARGISDLWNYPTPTQLQHLTGFSGDSQTGMLMADIGSYLPEDLLLLLDRSTMASSVEGRVPFLDHRLVEAALSVSPKFRTPKGEGKALERLMAKKYLPQTILKAPKRGFSSPVNIWFRNKDLVNQVKRFLNRQSARDRGWWKPSGLQALFSDPEKNSYKIYSLLMLELSIAIHIEERALIKAPEDGLEAYI